MRKTLLSLIFLFVLSPVFAQRVRDTFKLYFDLGVPSLNAKAEKKIDLLIYNDKIINGSNVVIVGYADYLGTEGFNKNLSMQRAKNVRDYLVKYGINANDIKMCLGKGEVELRGVAKSDGSPTDRRVDIVVNNRTRAKPPVTDNTKPGGRPGKDTLIKVALGNFDDMKRLKPGSLFLLKNVYFPPDRHVIKPESAETLEKLYVALRDNPKLKISIEGHVCCISDAPDALDIDTYEATLSVNRAKEIYNYLVRKGIDSKRLKYVGFGKRKPIIQFERTEEDADKNRRVEIRITEN